MLDGTNSKTQKPAGTARTVFERATRSNGPNARRRHHNEACAALARALIADGFGDSADALAALDDAIAAVSAIRAAVAVDVERQREGEVIALVPSWERASVVVNHG